VTEEAAVIGNAQVVTMMRPEGNTVPVVLHVEFGVSAFVMAVMEVSLSGVVASEVVVVVRFNLDYVIVEMLDRPHSGLVVGLFEEEATFASMPGEALAVDA